MKNTYRTLCAGLTWAALVTQYVLMAQSGDHGGIGASTFVYLSYFTILSNILVGLAFTAPLLKNENRLKRLFSRQAVRAATALYILVVAIVYWAVLAKIHQPTGLSAIANLGLHLILPILYIIDWLALAPKRAMKFKHLPLWTLFPLAYGLFNIIRGMISGFYPYPFLNITELGLSAVSVNMTGFLLIYLIGGALFIGLGRILPLPRP